MLIRRRLSLLAIAERNQRADRHLPCGLSQALQSLKRRPFCCAFLAFVLSLSW
jgi:hypothetical protein